MQIIYDLVQDTITVRLTTSEVKHVVVNGDAKGSYDKDGELVCAEVHNASSILKKIDLDMIFCSSKR